MKQKRADILMGLASLLIVAVMVVVLQLSNNSRRELTCSGLRVENATRLVSEQSIKELIEQGYGSFIGQRLDSVNLCKVEQVINTGSAVRKSEAFTTEDGMLNIKVTQLEPVMRLQNGQTGCYVDREGTIFPLQSHYSEHVSIIDGQIPVAFTSSYKGKAQSEKEKQWIEDAIAMLDRIESSRVWKEAFVQFHVNERGDMVLIPRIGREKFIIGDMNDIDSKLEKIERYYEYIKPANDSLPYKTVNVKYKDQIVCRK